MSYRKALRMLAVGCLTMLAVLLVNFAARSEQTLRVYHVGNSVTDTINYNGLSQLAQSRGHKHVFGRHTIPGAGLGWIWEHPADGFREEQLRQSLPGLNENAMLRWCSMAFYRRPDGS